MYLQKNKPCDGPFLRQFRQEHKCCEIGAEHHLEIAHITSKRSGDPDIEENILRFM
jgi:hypothetical protein